MRNNQVVFCNLGREGRIDEDVFACWARIIQRVPGSILWLGGFNEVVCKHLFDEWIHVHHMSSEQLRFAGYATPKVRHLMRLALADIYLDTLSYNGHTTTTDALWAGLNVVTLRGDMWASRVATSLIRSLDLREKMEFSSRKGSFCVDEEREFLYADNLKTQSGEEFSSRKGSFCVDEERSSFTQITSRHKVASTLDEYENMAVELGCSEHPPHHTKHVPSLSHRSLSSSRRNTTGRAEETSREEKEEAKPHYSLFSSSEQWTREFLVGLWGAWCWKVGQSIFGKEKEEEEEEEEISPSKWSWSSVYPPYLYIPILSSSLSA
eukprot:CAMPEP_0113878698 /NCGR_PEP_ID=MMETSP0780_2-20120614/6831_1 /TAXON_ID=652834 /ORGANISM="Palpitomonas bilix" /LENGTH=321 /DNA_ID=CAMNT_0000865205 /DNA_START=23 /DNA_END=987 /DNA_ORIENTATION=- /assembly_acc=CAM_ASM_000599